MYLLLPMSLRLMAEKNGEKNRVNPTKTRPDPVLPPILADPTRPVFSGLFFSCPDPARLFGFVFFGCPDPARVFGFDAKKRRAGPDPTLVESLYKAEYADPVRRLRRSGSGS